LIVFSLLMPVVSLRPVKAQDDAREKQEQDYKIQLAIEEQKKAMAEQKKSQEESLRNLKKAQEDLDESMRNYDVEVQVDDPDQIDKSVRTRVMRVNRGFSGDNHFIWNSAGGEPVYISTFDNNNESTSWQFSKRIKEKSLKSEYTFDVEKTSNTVVMSVMGDCKEGEIRIKIVMPNGKTYSDVVIDEFGNLNWRKSFTISDTENQDKTGPWKFAISSNKATGYFKISLESY
jgi:hypothetical protein